MVMNLICKIRKWELSDAKDLAVALSNKKIQDNLRDGLPYSYTEQELHFCHAFHIFHKKENLIEIPAEVC